MSIKNQPRQPSFCSDAGNLERVPSLGRRSKFPCAYAAFRFHTTQANTSISANTRKRNKFDPCAYACVNSVLTAAVRFVTPHRSSSHSRFVTEVSSAFFSCQLHDLRKNIYDFYIFCTSITVRRALPWPPNIVFNKLSASQRVRIGLTVTPPCKVRTVVS